MSWSTSITTPNLNLQDFFTTTLAQAVVDGTDTNIYLSTLPTATEGFLVIDPTNAQGASTRELIYYNSLGANYVTCPSAANGRGVVGTAQQHNLGIEVRMTSVAEYWQSLRDGYVFRAGSLGGVNASLATGIVCQTLQTDFSAVATGTTTTPYDDTIPQITEGDQYMTQVITPKSATNILVIEVSAMVAVSATGVVTTALHQDSTANALAASGTYALTTAAPYTNNLRYTMVAGTTSATTFRVRIGNQTAGTTTFNGDSAARRYGPIPKSSIKITEIKA